MADLHDPLLNLRYVGVPVLPEAGDDGDRRARTALNLEMSGRTPRRQRWRQHRLRIGGVAIPSVAALAVTATAAAATTGAVVTITATSLFQHSPQPINDNGSIETVLPSTVRVLSTVTIPDYGQVQVWGANTKPGGFCFALRLPDGDWGGLHSSQDAADGWYGGQLPGCLQTRQQAILQETPLRPGQQPSGTTGQVLEPTPLEAEENQIKTDQGDPYALYAGYVEAQGTAAAVRDPVTGATAAVMPGGYYVLAEPTSNTVANVGCNDQGRLEVLDAAGTPLRPDYTWGEMLPGSSVGPSQG